MGETRSIIRHFARAVLPLSMILAFAGASPAQELALVDSERIFDELGEIADARELLESEIEEWQAHADSLEETIRSIEEDLDRTLMMSPERRMEREALLREKQDELDLFVSSVFGPGGEIERRNEQLVSPIVARINEAIREVGLEEGYALILDVADGAVVYAEEGLDITDLVLERLAEGGGE
ncbi:OmpH family outer membrane protein [Candidatus Fermentibacterales bacterium]|nr:OmpH family outer membrane protein [Candidatus Fermentibacterales bacterium]